MCPFIRIYEFDWQLVFTFLFYAQRLQMFMNSNTKNWRIVSTGNRLITFYELFKLVYIIIDLVIHDTHTVHIFNNTTLCQQQKTRIVFHFGMGNASEHSNRWSMGFFFFLSFHFFSRFFTVLVVGTRKYGNSIGFKPWLFIWMINRPNFCLSNWHFCCYF